MGRVVRWRVGGRWEFGEGVGRRMMWVFDMVVDVLFIMVGGVVCCGNVDGGIVRCGCWEVCVLV